MSRAKACLSSADENGRRKRFYSGSRRHAVPLTSANRPSKATRTTERGDSDVCEHGISTKVFLLLGVGPS